MKYKLLASDFDNTLLRSDGTVSRDTLDAIRKYQSLGGKFLICTGRMFASIRREASLLGISGDVIAYNGGIVGDIDTGEIKYQSLIPLDISLEIVDYLESRGKIVHLYINDTLYINKANPYTDYYCKECKVQATPVGNLVDYLNKVKICPNKILLIDEPSEIDKYSDILASKGAGRYLVAKSAPNLLDIEGYGTSKGVAIKHIASLYGIDATECVCFGDSPNDISMLKVAGVGVAVDNATDEVKKVADYITDSCDNDGVKKVIDKIIRGTFYDKQ